MSSAKAGYIRINVLIMVHIFQIKEFGELQSVWFQVGNDFNV